MSKRGPTPPDISGETLLREPRKPGPSSPGFKWKASLLLAALAALVYLNTLHNDLVYDDALIVEQHLVIRDPSNFPDIWTKAGWLPNRTGIVYRPLSLWSFSVNYRLNEWMGLDGTDVVNYHIFNLMLHAVASCLLLLLLLRLRIHQTAALIAAAIFAVHPVHTEAVAALIGRAEMMAFIFGIVFLLNHQGRRHALLCSGAYLLAIWSKESGILFFPLAVAMDIIMSRKSETIPYRRYAVYGTVAVAWIITRTLALADGSQAVPFVDNPIVGMAWSRGFLTALSVQLDYLRIFAIPVSFSTDYSYNQLPIAASVVNYRVVIFLALLAFVIGLSWSVRRRHPAIGFAVLGYAVLFGATANMIIPIGTIMGERLTYAPSAMLCLLSGYGIWILSRKVNRIVGVGLPVFILAGCALVTIDRNTIWMDELTFFHNQVATAPQSAKAHYNLGATLAKHGRDEEAVASYRTSLLIFPYYAEPAFNLGNALRRMNANAEDVIGAYRNAIEYDPGHRKARANLAEYLIEAGNVSGASELIMELKQLQPDFPTLEYLEVRLYQKEQTTAQGKMPESMRIGVIAYAANEHDKAITYLMSAIEDPQLSGNLRKTALSLLARSYDVLGDATRSTTYRQQADAIE
jgi:protein O-mannosyl-transferase